MSKPIFKVSLSVKSLFKVIAQPFIDVNGVLSSWETEEINSFFNISLFSISSAIILRLSANFSISSLVTILFLTFKFPLAICSETFINSVIGFTILLAKK